MSEDEKGPPTVTDEMPTLPNPGAPSDEATTAKRPDGKVIIRTDATADAKAATAAADSAAARAILTAREGETKAAGQTEQGAAAAGSKTVSRTLPSEDAVTERKPQATKVGGTDGPTLVTRPKAPPAAPAPKPAAEEKKAAWAVS